MVQILYALLSILLLALFSLNMNRGLYSSETRMLLNEVSTQMTGIAGEFLDQIGNLPYDAATLSQQLITNTGALAPYPITGAPVCNPDVDGVNRYFDGCLVMNDLDGKTATRTVDGLTYEVSVELEYLQMASDNESNVPTFRKRAVVTVTSQDMTVGNPAVPLSISVQRVYNYPRVIG